MSPTFDEVLQSARSLPNSERANLIDELIETLEPEDAAPIEDAWISEIARRSRELDDGLVQPIPWEEVKRLARQRIWPNG
jgi:putative addiction module component (TIGR02574 family)